MTLGAIAEQFNAERTPTGSGTGRWAIPAIRRLIASPLTAPTQPSNPESLGTGPQQARDFG